jgi:hypothetical protein
MHFEFLRNKKKLKSKTNFSKFQLTRERVFEIYTKNE